MIYTIYAIIMISNLILIGISISDSVICTAAINKWRELERKAMLPKQQGNELPENSANAVQKAVD
jgi:hypothetical protein